MKLLLEECYISLNQAKRGYEDIFTYDDGMVHCMSRMRTEECMVLKKKNVVFVIEIPRSVRVREYHGY